jgi:hypothetical protein
MRNSRFGILVVLLWLMSCKNPAADKSKHCTIKMLDGTSISAEKSVCELKNDVHLPCEIVAHDLNEGLRKFSCTPIIPPFYNGFIDGNGKIIIPPRYVYASGFSEGLSAVSEKYNGKYGYINNKGKYAIPPRFDDAFEFRNGLAAVRTKSKLYFNDCCGHANGVYELVGGAWGYIDRYGNYIIEPRFNEAKSFKNGKAKVLTGALWVKIKGSLHELRGGRWQTIDKEGKVIQD